MRKLTIALFLLTLPSLCFAAWRYNPYTGKQDYYLGGGGGENSTLGNLSVMGTLGVGLTYPVAKLEIKGAGTATTWALKTQDSDGNDRFVILDNGNVGIGTTNPTKTLSVREYVGNTDDMKGISIVRTAAEGTETFGIYINQTEATRISTGASSGNKIRIESGGQFHWESAVAAGNTFVINDDSQDVDFRVESNDTTSLIRTDGFNNTVGINYANPSALFTVYASDTTPAKTLYIKSSGTGPGLTAGIVLQSSENTATCGYLRIESSTGPVSVISVTCP